MYHASRDIWPSIEGIQTPILMLHGNEDKIVPKNATIDAFEKIRSADKNKIIYDGMYHEIHNEVNKNQVYSDIISWINARE